MDRQEQTPSPCSLPSPPAWHPHPALQMLDHTLILLRAERKRLSSAGYNSLLLSVMAVHDFIVSEDTAGALSQEAVYAGRRSDATSSFSGVGLQRGWGSGVVEEALTPSAEDKRGTPGWQNGWSWEMAKNAARKPEPEPEPESPVTDSEGDDEAEVAEAEVCLPFFLSPGIF